MVLIMLAVVSTILSWLVLLSRHVIVSFFVRPLVHSMISTSSIRHLLLRVLLTSKSIYNWIIEHIVLLRAAAHKLRLRRLSFSKVEPSHGFLVKSIWHSARLLSIFHVVPLLWLVWIVSTTFLVLLLASCRSLRPSKLLISLTITTERLSYLLWLIHARILLAWVAIHKSLVIICFLHFISYIIISIAIVRISIFLL